MLFFFTERSEMETGYSPLRTLVYEDEDEDVVIDYTVDAVVTPSPDCSMSDTSVDPDGSDTISSEIFDGSKIFFDRGSLRNASKRSMSYPTYEGRVKTVENMALIASKSPSRSSPSLSDDCGKKQIIFRYLTEIPVAPDTVSKYLQTHSPASVRRMGDIFELINGERAQCISIQDLIVYFKQNSNILSKNMEENLEFAKTLFEHHYKFLSKLRNLQRSDLFIEKIGETLATHLQNHCQDSLVKSYANITVFCKVASARPGKSIPSCLQSVALRLTKYKIQLESILKHSKEEEECEKKNIETAHARTKEVLSAINTAVATIENNEKLKFIQQNLDHKSFLDFGKKRSQAASMFDNNLLQYSYEINIVKENKMIPAELLVLQSNIMFVSNTGTKKCPYFTVREPQNVFLLEDTISRSDASGNDEFYVLNVKNQHMTRIKTDSLNRRNEIMNKLYECTAEAVSNKHVKHQLEILKYSQEADESIKTFEDSVKKCLHSAQELSKDSSSSRIDVKLCQQKAQKLQEVAHEKSLKLLQFCRSGLNKIRSRSGDSTEPQLDINSIIDAVDTNIEKLQRFSSHALSLCSVDICKGESPKFDDSVTKLEQIRIQNEILENKKTLLQEESAQIISDRADLIRREKEVADREKRLLLRSEALEIYMGAILTKNNKVIATQNCSPVQILDYLSQHNVICNRETSDINEVANETGRVNTSVTVPLRYSRAMICKPSVQPIIYKPSVQPQCCATKTKSTGDLTQNSISTSQQLQANTGQTRLRENNQSRSTKFSLSTSIKNTFRKSSSKINHSNFSNKNDSPASSPHEEASTSAADAICVGVQQNTQVVRPKNITARNTLPLKLAEKL